MGKLTGKVAIVTASSDGIGLSIAARLAEDGASVMISSRKQQNVDRAVEQLRKQGLVVSGTVCHVAKKEHRQKLIEKTVNDFGGIDLLVSNAAVNPMFGQILDSTEDAWDKIFEVNVKATFFLVKEVVPFMEKRGYTLYAKQCLIKEECHRCSGGRDKPNRPVVLCDILMGSKCRGGSIVIVSSQGGYVPSEFMGAYSTSKTALVGLTKALVPQLSRKEIRVNCIAPGAIKTHFSQALWENERSDEFIKMIPLKRFGKPEECSGIVSFLLSTDASYITGETVVVSGGTSGRL